MDSSDRFKKISLPSNESFYDIINDQHISDDHRARQNWFLFNVQDMKGYRNHYLLTDVLLLGDVFEKFSPIYLL
jgi:hypothetical protein